MRRKVWIGYCIEHGLRIYDSKHGYSGAQDTEIDTRYRGPVRVGGPKTALRWECNAVRPTAQTRSGMIYAYPETRCHVKLIAVRPQAAYVAAYLLGGADAAVEIFKDTPAAERIRIMTLSTNLGFNRTVITPAQVKKIKKEMEDTLKKWLGTKARKVQE